MTSEPSSHQTALTVVFDTNVLIPAIIPASRSIRLFRDLIMAGHRVMATPQIIDEVRDKMTTKESLRTWLGVSDDDIDRFIADLQVLCDILPGHVTADGAVPADPKDDMIIAAALEAHASYLISEDKHLLNLGQYQGITIMNRDDFADELARLTSD